MSYNPTINYGTNAFKTDKTQQKIAGIEDKYQMSILGADYDQDALRDNLSRMRNLLGEIRVRAQEIVQEQKAELEARKGLLELGKA